MKIALVFPGQGVQKVGMGEEICKEFEGAENLYERADELLGFSIKDLSFRGPQNELTESKNAQPAILLHSYAIFNELKDKLNYDLVAGHSLGEYTAHLVAGTFSFSNALHLVRFRGELMSATENGTMSAIIGLEAEKIKSVLGEINGTVVTANFNSPGQTVISGEVSAVKKVGERLKEEGGRVIPLSVSGAFHSPLMEEVFEPFRKVLLKTEIKKPAVPVYSNVTAKKVRDPEKIREVLGEQVLKPVRWVQILEGMKNDGVEKIIEIGRGRVLSKLIKQTIEGIQVKNISTVEDIRRFLNGE